MHTLRGKGIIVGPPKTAAGERTVAIPPHIVDDLEAHLASYVGPEPEDLVFTERAGGPLRVYTVERAWRKSETPSEYAI
jgi:integrase